MHKHGLNPIIEELFHTGNIDNLQRAELTLVENLQQIIGHSVTKPESGIPTAQPGTFPFSGTLLRDHPDIFKAIANQRAITTDNTVKAPTGLEITIPLPPANFVISVFLNTNNTTPALIFTVFGLSLLSQGPDNNYTVAIDPGSIWILSELLSPDAPAGMYTGLTINSGTISFNQEIPPENFEGTSPGHTSITMPAGAVFSVSLNLKQPVDTTVPSGNIGIDAMNAQVQLPDNFSFNLANTISIVSIAQASWQLYGSSNTFQYDPAQSPTYDSGTIFIAYNASPAAAFVVSECNSSFFTILGTAVIDTGFWELPVATIDLTQTNTATGATSLSAICEGGLQVTWAGLKGGWVNLQHLSKLSATVGVIGVRVEVASNRYGTQHYDLWSNEATGRLSTLDISYTDGFALSFVSAQNDQETLTTSVKFLATIDRPVLVDGNPVSLKGTNGTLCQTYTLENKIFLLYDSTLIAENFTPPGTVLSALPPVPLEAIALTNGLLTITPAAGLVISGNLATPTTFEQAGLTILFGLYNLLPALPDPYASSMLSDPSNDPDNSNASLTVKVSWPRPVPNSPQLADMSFTVSSLSNIANHSLIKTPSAFIAPNALEAQQTEGLGTLVFSLLDVSTNADLMGVSLSSNNIEVVSEGERYSIRLVDNSAETDFLQILGMDLSSPGKFLRAFTVPEISWEPVLNLAEQTDPNLPNGMLFFGDDGGPTQIFNDSSDVIPIAPIKVSNFIVDSYTNNTAGNPLITAAWFTLPFGMISIAMLLDSSKYPAEYRLPTLSLETQDFNVTPLNVPNAPKKIVTSGLQIAAKGQQDTDRTNTSASFMGFTIQSNNILDSSLSKTNSSILGAEVTGIFNNQFGALSFINQVGVPLERIDFSGYGASMFSNWQDPDARIAATSQAKFDVIVGRTSLEIIQVKSLIYPWGIRVVRTITMSRAGTGFIFRLDSGWRAETDGVYDFSYIDQNGKLVLNPYTFHPGVVKGVFNVKNILENNLPQFTAQWIRNAGETYIDPTTQTVSTVPSAGVTESILLQPVYFDADVQIDDIIKGGKKGKVSSKQMLGYIQLAPRGEPISPVLFGQLLDSQSGSLGGPVDCIVNIGGSGQHMRITRVDVSGSVDPSVNTPIFTGTARGTVILPKDGSWSIVQHSHATRSVSAIDNNAPVPLIRVGQLLPDGTSDYPGNQLRLANPIDLLKDPDDTTVDFGLLQNTGTQKVLYQLPAYLAGVTRLLSKDNDFSLGKFADAFHLVNSTGIFPNPDDVPDMQLSDYDINLIDQGYQLLNKVTGSNLLQRALSSPWYFVKTKDLQLYIDYDKSSDKQNLNYALDSSVEKWISSTKNIRLNVALGKSFDPLIYIDGNLDSASGADTAFNLPQLQFGDALCPIREILQVLDELSTGEYAAVVQKAMEVVMSNTGDNFEYKFHADKEIATLQFPAPELDSAITPLRLTAGLKVGVYFNEVLAITSDPSHLIPSAGAYFEFDGGIQVMCVSLAAATIYAVGQVTVKLSADTKTGLSLYMKFGFGVELMVGLPVVGNVSLTYMAGIDMTLSSEEIKVTAFLLFKGQADLLDGLVNITITIEASGSVDRPKDSGKTSITAQVTFAIDICLFLIIDIDFSTSWSEKRQIA